MSYVTVVSYTVCKRNVRRKVCTSPGFEEHGSVVSFFALWFPGGALQRGTKQFIIQEQLDNPGQSRHQRPTNQQPGSLLSLMPPCGGAGGFRVAGLTAIASQPQALFMICALIATDRKGESILLGNIVSGWWQVALGWLGGRWGCRQ